MKRTRPSQTTRSVPNTIPTDISLATRPASPDSHLPLAILGLTKISTLEIFLQNSFPVAEQEVVLRGEEISRLAWNCHSKNLFLEQKEPSCWQRQDSVRHAKEVALSQRRNCKRVRLVMRRVASVRPGVLF